MESPKLLLNGAIIIGIIATSTAKDYITYTGNLLPRTIIPIHYDITFDLNKAKLIVNFAVKIYIEHETYYVVFHGPRPQLHEEKFFCTKIVTENDIAYLTDYKDEKHIPYKQKYNRKTDMYTIIFPHKVPAGEYHLQMKFNFAKYNDFFTPFNTMTYFDTYQKSKISTAIYFHSIGARDLFPCWDEPQIKATFQISIALESNYTVLSNTIVENINYQYHSSKHLVIFRRTPAIPVHLLAIAAVEDFTDLRDENVNIFYRKELPTNVIQFAWEVAKRVTNYLESAFIKLKNKIEQMNHVIMPNYPDDGTSSWGLILYK